MNCRLWEHLRISRRKRSIQQEWDQILRIHTVATVAIAFNTITRTLKSKASHHQHHHQLQLITEQPREEREYHTEPQWED